MVGHYGKSALIAGGLAVLLLVLHLAVDFGVQSFSEESGLSNEPLTRGDMVDLLEDGNHPALSHPGVTLAGIILMVIAGVLLVGLGLAPLGVAVARLVGWTGGALGATGAFMALTSSLFAWGTGFSTLLGAIFGNANPGVRIWIVSPVLVAIGAVAAGHFFLRVLTRVVASGGGLRDGAKAMLKAPTFVALFLFAILVMPWAILPQDGADNEASGRCRGLAECEGTVNFVTAWGASEPVDFQVHRMGTGPGGLLEAAEASEDTRFEVWQHLAFGIELMVAAAWIAFFVALVGTAGHLVASIIDVSMAPRIGQSLQLANLIMLPWAAIHLLLAFIYQWKPSYDNLVEATTPEGWLFGFLPLLTVAPLAMLIMHQMTANMATLRAGRGLVEKAQKSSHSFE